MMSARGADRFAAFSEVFAVDDDLSGGGPAQPEQPERAPRDGSRVRGALGSRSAGWIVAAFLGGVVVTLAAVMIAGPQVATVRSVSLAGPVTARPRMLPGGPNAATPRRIQFIGPGQVRSWVAAGAAVPCRVFGPGAVAVPGGMTIVRKGHPGRVTIYFKHGHKQVVAIAPARLGAIKAWRGRHAAIYVRGKRMRQVLIRRGAITLMPAGIPGCQVLAPVLPGAGRP